MLRSYPRLAAYVVPAFVAFSLAVTAGHQARQIALDQENVDTFYSFAGGFEEYKELRQEWRPRILANASAGLLVRFAESRGLSGPQEVMPYVASSWALGWLLATFALFVALTRERALLYILGIFAGIAFAYATDIGFTRFYPYELPALFCFACFVGLLMLGRLEWLLLLVPVATLFKETALILPIAFLFWTSVGLRRRLLFMLATIALALVVKGVVDIVTENPSPLLTMTAQEAGLVPRWQENLGLLLDVRAWTTHPVFLNAGLLVAMLLLPISDRRIGMLKALAVLFAAGNFLFGLVTEYRIWFELIPLSLYAIDLHFFGSPALGRLARGHPEERPHTW